MTNFKVGCVTGKEEFGSEGLAWCFVRYLRRRFRTFSRVYRCPECDQFHLTTQEPDCQPDRKVTIYYEQRL